MASEILAGSSQDKRELYLRLGRLGSGFRDEPNEWQEKFTIVYAEGHTSPVRPNLFPCDPEHPYK
jgi:hypothetical protein